MQSYLDAFAGVMVVDAPRRRSGSPLEQLKTFFVIIVAQLHLHPFAPHRGQIINFDKSGMGCFLEDDSRILQLFIDLIEFGKVNPQGVQLPHCLLGVDRLQDVSLYTEAAL